MAFGRAAYATRIFAVSLHYGISGHTVSHIGSKRMAYLSYKAAYACHAAYRALCGAACNLAGKIRLNISNKYARIRPRGCYIDYCVAVCYVNGSAGYVSYKTAYITCPLYGSRNVDIADLALARAGQYAYVRRGRYQHSIRNGQILHLGTGIEAFEQTL